MDAMETHSYASFAYTTSDLKNTPHNNNKSVDVAYVAISDSEKSPRIQKNYNAHCKKENIKVSIAKKKEI